MPPTLQQAPAKMAIDIGQPLTALAITVGGSAAGGALVGGALLRGVGYGKGALIGAAGAVAAVGAWWVLMSASGGR